MKSSKKALNKILFVDDDPDICSVVEIALATIANYDLVVCKNGHEAIEKSKSLLPDLLLLDIMMPEIDGLTLCDHLREQEGYQNIPVIFVTAKVHSRAINNYKEKGAIGVISKPFDPIQLGKMIDSLWDQFQNKP